MNVVFVWPYRQTDQPSQVEQTQCLRELCRAQVENVCKNTLLSSGQAQFKWNSRQEATEALFVIEYESNLCAKA